MARPTAPTSSLPPLGPISLYPHAQIVAALANLRTLYFPPKPSVLIPIPTFRLAKRMHKCPLHDDRVPDSGYASATSGSESGDEDENEDEERQALEALRADPFERAFAVKWLTGLTARAEAFLEPAFPILDVESAYRSATLDDAAVLLSAFVAIESEDEDDSGLVRAFSFPTEEGGEPVEVQLTDAPVQSGDHTSVGLQSWASAVLLSSRLCADPAKYGLTKPARVLELGAGTGLLSLAVAKLFARQPEAGTVVATDFHPDVLANLGRNVVANFPSAPDAVQVCVLDWEHAARDCARAPLDEHFSVVLAADVVYAPEHAGWLRACAERVLAPNGVLWMVLAQRGTGRHQGLVDAVDDVFPSASAAQFLDKEGGAWLGVLHREEIARMGGYGRADEGGYRLYKIGWILPEP
ncbi:S-adenosyl-L-methionine-dependent methyltransferase [Vararia minispora EC-137]|uniref:S-adenosyl-L-methionine-dependent methyltransferase n=1 Tax=Vararia minispora EC-137 TaxID=1314806 RepID=A0ACB8QPR2_9AGAM|nr:S-adenosyl-L-methionine-dependent methyltransferase [Vararia minispora EC-137]